MNTTIRLSVDGEVVERRVRRVRTLEDGTNTGWVSLNGRDTKVFRGKRKRVWVIAG